ncbi:MAG: TetR/AcrR family transcriptional regulator [Ruminococcaceae bacterium]|nr:TetR/AcrR family transcriptional regulator [Oscillospiraceae bacterium]
MSKKKNRNTKGKIVSAAWRLFYTQGYDDTTIEEIIEESETSRGSFYHYFEGKDALLSSLSYLFDEKYSELEGSLEKIEGSFEKLMYLNRELFDYIENNISLDLLARLYSSQLITKGEKHLLDHNRVYYKLLRRIVSEGQACGELTKDVTVNEIVKTYALCERALLYDWCICSGEYSLKSYGEKQMPMFLWKLKA